MKYMLLGYTNAQTWDDQVVSAEEVQRICDFYEQFEQELRASGEWVGSEGLADPSHTTTVQQVDGVPVATDGPYAELKESLVSFSIIDVASHDRAVEIAARVVGVTGEPIEIRPIMDGPPGDG
ncbi:YciI family protein [Intrasporangium sp.]|uniref:YciI family protein n=1 Tax=Intrasporangium sp. TaxID=1925024 RepID=UPI002939E675|nr:YciI family protein [Intrasporangium sp.]MDV3222294.1 YciI family protein [Intrasporangium sp.]